MSFENWTLEKNVIWGKPIIPEGATEEEAERITKEFEDAKNAALKEYEQVANWCNEVGDYTIIDDGEYYRVVKVEEDENLEESEAENGDMA